MPERTVESRRAFDGRLISVRVDEIETDSGRRATREVVEHPGAVAVLPVHDDGTIVLVRQYRYAVGRSLLEVPAGTREPGEPDEETARRELREEVGLEASSWLEISRLVPVGSVLELREISYLAWDLHSAERDPDPQEVLKIKRLPFKDAVDMALAGEITNAGTVACILIAHAKAARGELPHAIADRLR